MEAVLCCGITFNVVNKMPRGSEEQFFKTVAEFIQGGSKHDVIESVFKFVAGGACGRVYDLGNGMVLKINNHNTLGLTPDGDILKDLQGVPFIPKLYCYSECNRFVVVQKIDGVNFFDYHGQFVGETLIDRKDFDELFDKAVQMIRERNWVMNDIHGGNCMIDKQGSIWIVDVGLFKGVTYRWGEHGHFHEIATDVIFEHNTALEHLKDSYGVADEEPQKVSADKAPLFF